MSKIRNIALLALLASGSALAADPASGTLSPAMPEQSYTYGPNTISNPSGTGQLTCAEPAAPCDAYALTVDVPTGNFQMTIFTTWDVEGEDYDLYLLNEAGMEIASSASSDPTETIILPNLQAGNYTVRLVPFLVTGSTATTTITLSGASGGGGGGSSVIPDPVGTSATPRYKVHVAPEGLANESGEPTIGYNPLSKRGMYISFTQALRITFKENLPAPADSLNAMLPEACDAQWEDKTGLITTLNTLDPLMYTDKTTGRTWNSQLSGANSLFEYSDDDGETWTPGQIGPANGGADHQGMVSGPYPPGFPLAGLLYDRAFYYCSQSVVAAFCARSDDGAQTQGPGFVFKNFDCAAGGLHGHPQVSEVDGTLYVPDSSQCIASTGIDGSSGNVIVHVSEDAGQTFETRPIPTSVGGAGSDPSLGIASDGTIYMCYENADSTVHMAVSHDKGITWVNDIDIGAAAGLIQTRFPAAMAGDPNRAACAFLGTKTPGDGNSLAFEGVWYPYVATTYDGGLTYELVNVSPTDAVQGFGGVGPDGTNRNLLDFNDLEMDERGRTIFAYADGCIGGCVKDPSANSFAAKGTVVRQTGGRTLLSAFDNAAGTQYNVAAPIKPAAACAVQTESIRTATRTNVVWREPDTGGSAIRNYEVFRATSAAGPFVKVGDAGAKTSFNDTTADRNVPIYYYRVVAQNLLGDAPVSNIIELPITVEEIVDTCTLPGQIIALDALGDGAGDDTDIDFVGVAEPEAFEGNLVITVKMAGFTSGEPAPSSFIAALFPSKGNLYIALDSTGGAPAFTYGTYADVAQGVLQFTEAGNLDERSSFGADGTIVMVAPYSIFGGLNVGDVLAGFDVRARIGARSATSRDTAGPGDYIVRGVDICSALPPIEPPVVLPPAPVKDEGRFGTTALDWLILAPLFGFALRRRKR